MIKKFKKIPKFFREVKEEFEKVSWCSRRELMGYTIAVIIISAFLTSYVAGIDMGFSKLVQILFK